MNLKHIEFEIPKNNPFENCKLDRRKYAEILTDIINSYNNGFVLSINNKWGAGKTTFVKMWEQDLNNKGHKTIYFNAWENDFEDNPLTALMGELKSLTKKSTEPEFKSTLKKASLLTKNIAPVIVQAIADKYIDTKGIKDAISGVTKGLSDIFESEVNDYAEKKKSITEFKKSLSEFIANTYEEKPLVFIIDELDRCRPNYAVSILEQIKHFFSVPNIIFVLSIDKIQLGHAIKGVYGSDLIDSDEYLRRFIDLEYSIPEPDTNIFHEYLYEFYRFDDFFNSNERQVHRAFKYDSHHFLKTSRLLFENQNIPLRQQEKIFSLSRVALKSFSPNNYVIPNIFLFLAFIKVVHTKFYLEIKSKKLKLSEFQDKFLKLVIRNKNNETENDLMWFEAYLVNAYHNFLETKYNRKKLYDYDNTINSNKLFINSIVNPDKNSNLLEILESINRGRGEGDLDIEYFINRIELLENLRT